MLNLRVYGILINEKNQVLVSDEYIRGKYITKFPGGGLEEGEGTIDCLKREFMEEMSLTVEITQHIYTTDFYQPSAFRKGDQIISIYYQIKPLQPITVPLRSIPFEFDAREMKLYEVTGETETFRFIDAVDFRESCVTLPIDKIVVGIVKNKLLCE